MSKWDIHDYAGWIEKSERRLDESSISARNKRLIREFDRFCILQRLSIPRRAKLRRHVIQIAEMFIQKPFGQVKKRDIQDAVAAIEAQDAWSLWTKHDTKVALRKFFKWIVQRDRALTNDEFPAMVSWIKPALKRKDLCRVKASDLLQPEETERLIDMAMGPRDKAILALLYELGARIGEIGSLSVGDISRDDYSLLVDLDGKTGKRTVRVIQYASFVVAWLNTHPLRSDPQAPLWPSFRGYRYLKPLRYAEFSRIVKQAKQAAGIRKRTYPHLFRHSRVTHLLAAGKLNEAQAKVFFGWVPDSHVLSTYAHLVTKDANDAILRMHGIQKTTPQQSQDARCGMCSAINPAAAAFCFRCSYPLGAQEANEAQMRRKESEARLATILKHPEVQELLKRIIHESERSDGKDAEIPRQVAQRRGPIQEDETQHQSA